MSVAAMQPPTNVLHNNSDVQNISKDDGELMGGGYIKKYKNKIYALQKNHFSLFYM